MKNRWLYLTFTYTLFFTACQFEPSTTRDRIDLTGPWQFALDTADTGIEGKWFLSQLSDEITLPGTTDTNQKGFLNKDTTTLHLNRVYKYEGVCWYRKEVNVPESFSNKSIWLHLERTKSSQVWVDDQLVGSSKLLQTPQTFDLSDYISPGKHSITLRIDNSLSLTPYGNVHIYADETQTNWNGVIGDIFMEARDRTFIDEMKVFPDIDDNKFTVDVSVIDGSAVDSLEVEYTVTLGDNIVERVAPQIFQLDDNSSFVLDYAFNEPALLWDEYDQPIYTVQVKISGVGFEDEQWASFGMRKFMADGTQFKINGRTTFLRGKHDASVFPITGHVPTDVPAWRQLYQVAKSYGINHYRFHSYCPPEAAFTAADLEGIYLQAELPFWGGLDSDTIAQALKEEGLAMLKAYGNHPSFVMFSHGNELWSGHNRAIANMEEFKESDPRPLYTIGSNNSIGYMMPPEVSDFHVATRTPSDGDTILTHTRLTHAFVDSRDGATLNTQVPSTQVNFEYPVRQIEVPLVSHEIGQYQIYPDYSEIDQYNGVLKAWNLEVFRKRLNASGLGEMDSIFQKATGAWSALCYKAEMEAALRTEGFGGFQLLDLQDFPGQGTALVGILNSFMESKEVVSQKEWLQSCNDVVVLAEFPKYTWSGNETFSASVEVANYSNRSLDAKVGWKLVYESGDELASGEFGQKVMTQGGLTRVGAFSVILKKIRKAVRLNLRLMIDGTEYDNSYPIWVYPVDSENIEVPKGIIVTETLDTPIVERLAEGTKVLFFPNPEDIASNSVAGLFPPDFWNYGMFKGISEWAKKPVSPGTLGLLMDPEHPIFEAFPTDCHSNWQWFDIVKNSRSLILDKMPKDYLPIVQVVDNLERNHKMGMVFEFKLGEGKLLVCTAQLTKIKYSPVANSFYLSILKYMESEAFDPEVEVGKNVIDLLN